MPPKDTTKLLLKLRSLMKDTQLLNGKKLDAYIIPSSDAHGSEYLSEKDKRREFISGFSGSSGTALVTNVPTEAALLWTDGRYYLQASHQLDSNWTLMKDGLADTPSISDWLISNLSKDSNRVVGIDARLYEEDLFIGLYTKLNSNKIDLIHVDKNLIDLVWEEYGKPNFVERPIIKLNTRHTGKRTKEKLKDIRDQMIKLNTNSYVITSLDEIAWLLNLRGQDIPFGAVFFSYCLVTLDGVKLFTNTKRLDEKCMLENNVESTIRSYLLGEDDKFEFYEYDDFYNYFYKFVQNEYVKKEGKNNENNKKKIYLSSQSNHAIHSWVPLDSIHKDMSIIAKAKIIKNHEEIEAAKTIHKRDSATLVEFFYLVDKQFQQDNTINYFNIENLNEYNLGNFLDNLRAKHSGFLRPSFETICSIGSNGSIIHYKAKEETAKRIEANNLLLLDSGGHYVDMGTTDVTRTVYLGDKSKITDYQKECFTRVLKGHICLSTTIFPHNTRSELLDSFARQALWQVGLEYRHGTGHGVGALLNVHEVPIISYRKSIDIGLQENMIVTIEPGYYEDNNFGIRIENCVLTTKKLTKYQHLNINFCQFEPLTYVPIQKELIEKNLLSQGELEWLNEYHEKCLKYIGPLLKERNKDDVYEWLTEQTKPL